MHLRVCCHSNGRSPTTASSKLSPAGMLLLLLLPLPSFAVCTGGCCEASGKRSAAAWC